LPCGNRGLTWSKSIRDGYGIASLAVGVLREGVGLSLGSIYGRASALAVIMAVLAYAVTGAEPSVTASHP